MSTIIDQSRLDAAPELDCFLRRSITESGGNQVLTTDSMNVYLVVLDEGEEEEGVERAFETYVDDLPEAIKGLERFRVVPTDRQEVVEVQVLPTAESSYLCYGYAAPKAQRRARRDRRPIRESIDQVKQIMASSRPLLRHLVTLKDCYDQDPQLGGAEAKTAMQALLAGIHAADPTQVHELGSVDYQPNQLAWMQMFDQIGDQHLGQWLGLRSTEDLPTDDLDDRVDAVKAEAGLDQQDAEDDSGPHGLSPENGPEALVASTRLTPANLHERGVRRFHAIHMAGSSVAVQAYGKKRRYVSP